MTRNAAFSASENAMFARMLRDRRAAQANRVGDLRAARRPSARRRRSRAPRRCRRLPSRCRRPRSPAPARRSRRPPPSRACRSFSRSCLDRRRLVGRAADRPARRRCRVTRRQRRAAAAWSPVSIAMLLDALRAQHRAIRAPPRAVRRPRRCAPIGDAVDGRRTRRVQPVRDRRLDARRRSPADADPRCSSRRRLPDQHRMAVHDAPRRPGPGMRLEAVRRRDGHALASARGARSPGRSDARNGTRARPPSRGPFVSRVAVAARRPRPRASRPCVRVPVLSKATHCTAASCSSLAPPLIRTPLRAAAASADTIDTGVEITSAHGHEITSSTSDAVEPRAPSSVQRQRRHDRDQDRQHEDDRGVDAREAIDERLARRALRLRALDQVDDARDASSRRAAG